MNRITILTGLALAAALAGCASTASTEFAAEARKPNAAEVTSIFRGHTFTLDQTKVVYGPANEVAAFFGGRSDTGTWTAEDGRICFSFKVIPSACNEVRMVGQDIFLKRSNGRVSQLKPAG